MKYPIGIQTFENIIQDGYVYVDKTALVHQLVSMGKVYFLSRPRRFGKSLLLSTLKAYFEGKKELFHGLAMEQLETEWKTYPVFHLSLGSGIYRNSNELMGVLDSFVADMEDEYGKSRNATTLAIRFRDVIKAAHKKAGQKVVVLVDEYDKPLLDIMGTHTEVEVEGNKVMLEDYNRAILQGFYGVLKDADPDLKFVMLTGVTKFSQVSVFSGFNQPDDISMNARYEALCGITKEELTTYFATPIREMAERAHISDEEMVARLKQQYDGYHFCSSMRDIFNPFSLINCFNRLEIANYWFTTGTPSYLMRLLAHTSENINELVGKYYPASEFADYKADTEKPLPMIYQSGYLTIKDYDSLFNSYLLDFPNKEVRSGFLDMLSSNYFKKGNANLTWVQSVVQALRRGDSTEAQKLPCSR